MITVFNVCKASSTLVAKKEIPSGRAWDNTWAVKDVFPLIRLGVVICYHFPYVAGGLFTPSSCHQHGPVLVVAHHPQVVVAHTPTYLQLGAENRAIIFKHDMTHYHKSVRNSTRLFAGTLLQGL